MIRIGSFLAVAGCVAAVTVAGCGGTSHNESSAQVCSKLETDAKTLQSGTATTDLKQYASQAKSVADKFNADVAHAKSPQLRDGVSKVTAVLDTLASDLSSGTAPVGSKLTQIESQLKSAETELKGQCPQLSDS